MKLTATHYYLVLLVTSVLGIAYIAVDYFYIIHQENPISKTKNHFVTPTIKHNDTLLSIQTTKDSGCHTSGVLLTEAQILALPQHQFTTLHKWAPVAETFRGPLLEDILNLTCKDAKSIELKALNEYSLALDFESTKKYKPIVAHSVNGNRLPIRDKGPLWIMIDHGRYDIQKKNLGGMMIWQLSDILVLDSHETL